MVKVLSESGRSGSHGARVEEGLADRELVEVRLPNVEAYSPTNESEE